MNTGLDSKKLNYEKVLNTGILLSAQRNMSLLFETILTEAMSITNCDAGTLYLYEDDLLKFKIMHNHTLNAFMGGLDESIDLPPVPISEENVCAYVVIHRELENIEDVYCSKKFDFSGPKKYDELTGYKTRSMLVIPLENNKGEAVGVLQLINAKDGEGNIVPFEEDFEQIFRSIASQAAIAVTNMKYTKEIKILFNSLVQVLATAIDERTPYNANHTKNVAHLSETFIDFINKKHEKQQCPLYFDEDLKEQIVMAAWLHDVGKIAVPLEIMDKSTRLGDQTQIMEMRYEIIYLTEKNRFLEGKLDENQWRHLSAEIQSAQLLWMAMNTADAVEDDDIQKLRALEERVTVTEAGQQLPWLLPMEFENLSVKYGTLTPEERKIMETHVSITERLLSKIHFTNEYKDVPTFAASHHERLNGGGYPKGLKAKDMPMATRLLGVMDVFEALTARDRPYKNPISLAQAMDVLDEMASEGDLDKDLVDLLKEQYAGMEEVGTK